MKFTVLTLFPEMVQGPLSLGLLGKAIAAGVVNLDVIDIRNFSKDKHRTVDDVPFGGGQGMVLKAEPVVEAIEHARGGEKQPGKRVILLSPQGRRFEQAEAQNLAQLDEIILVCGRYEGFDERIRGYVDDELSIGDYVLSGGEFAALVIVDSVMRLVPGVLGNEASPQEDSFSNGMLEYPQFTRPRNFRGAEVPQVLLSGDHGRIAKWRHKEALCRTKSRRPELLDRLELTQEDRYLLENEKQ